MDTQPSSFTAPQRFALLFGALITLICAYMPRYGIENTSWESCLKALFLFQLFLVPAIFIIACALGYTRQDLSRTKTIVFIAVQVIAFGLSMQLMLDAENIVSAVLAAYGTGLVSYHISLFPQVLLTATWINCTPPLLLKRKSSQ